MYSTTEASSALNIIKERLWSLEQTCIEDYIIKRPREDIRPRVTSTFKSTSLKQTYLDRSLSITTIEPVYSHSEFINKHKNVRRAKSTRKKPHMADFTDFVQQNNAEVELIEQVERDLQTPTQDEHPTRPDSRVSSNTSSSSSDNDCSTIKTLQTEIESLKRRLECQEGEDKKKKKKRNVTTFSMPPPPPVGHPLQKEEETEDAGLQQKTNPPRTVMSLLIHLTTLMTVRMDDYSTAYQLLIEMRGTKTSQVVTRVLAELLTVWAKGLTTEPGNSSCIDFLIRSISSTLSTKSLTSTTWGSLIKYFQKCGTPGGTAVRTTKGSSPSAFTMTTTGHTTTSYTTAHGRTTHAVAGGSLDGIHGRSRVRHINPQTYTPKTFDDLQSTSAREGDDIYISKSQGPIGGHVIKLEVYKTEDIRDLARMEWWTVAQFRGTLMTDSRETLETAVRLQDQMETELESRPDTRFIKSSLNNIRSRGQWRK